eukprot:449642_1
MLSYFLSILSIIFIRPLICQNPLICGAGQSLISAEGTNKCDSDNACEGCELTLTSAEIFGCSKPNACANILASITANPQSPFLMECLADNACARSIENCGAKIVINCGSATSMKGIKCVSRAACENTIFEFIGTCEIEEIECKDGGCNGAVFIMNNVSVKPHGFHCGDAAVDCQNIVCKGSPQQCPQGVSYSTAVPVCKNVFSGVSGVTIL